MRATLMPVPALAVAVRENLRTFRVAARLGWQVEGNWADPLIFFIFTVLRPMATALILIVMYQVIAGGDRDGRFTYLYLSNAFFVLVIETMAGMSWSVLEDRENYKMLKYIFTSPARRFAYLLGRSLAKMSIGLLTTLILLVTGLFFLGLRLDVNRVEWAWLALYLPLGVAVLSSLGLILAGVALVVARHGGAIGEVVAGSMLLFSGAYFQVDILPDAIRLIALANPVTYWLEGMRRALHGGIIATNDAPGSPPVSPALAAYDNWQILAILVIAAAVTAFLSFFFYRWVEHQAQERGMIDRLTGY